MPAPASQRWRGLVAAMAVLSAAFMTAAGRAEPAANDASFAVRYAAIEMPADTAPAPGPPSAGPLAGSSAPAKPQSPMNRSDALAYYRALIEKEAGRQGLAPAIAEAVMAVESGYSPGAIGDVGEIGLMQILPSTARMLGFTGSNAELAMPENNIRYGVTYLAQAPCRRRPLHRDHEISRRPRGDALLPSLGQLLPRSSRQALRARISRHRQRPGGNLRQAGGARRRLRKEMPWHSRHRPRRSRRAQYEAQCDCHAGAQRKVRALGSDGDEAIAPRACYPCERIVSSLAGCTRRPAAFLPGNTCHTCLPRPGPNSRRTSQRGGDLLWSRPPALPRL